MYTTAKIENEEFTLICEYMYSLLNYTLVISTF